MKLIRFGEVDNEKPGILIGEKRFEISSIDADYNEVFLQTMD